MSEAAASPTAGRPLLTPRAVRTLDVGGLVLTLVTMLFAVFWAFPLYWAAITTLKPEYEVIVPGVSFWPREFTLSAYVYVFTNTQIGIWYLNSLATSAMVTAGVI